jgi:hypothetical protein
MQKELKEKAKAGLKLIQETFTQTIRREGIFPFTERPCEEKRNMGQAAPDNKLHAADLFSLFTADIIREDVVFVR